MNRLENIYLNRISELPSKMKNYTLEQKTDVLSYNLSLMTSNIRNSITFPEDKEIHLKAAKSDMSDLITNIQIFCQTIEWDFDEVRRDGLIQNEKIY